MTRFRGVRAALVFPAVILLSLTTLGSAAQARGSADTEAAPGRSCRGVETWREVGVTYFPAPQGLLRSQGMTTDGKSWYFSWQGGLEHC